MPFRHMWLLVSKSSILEILAINLYHLSPFVLTNSPFVFSIYIHVPVENGWKRACHAGREGRMKVLVKHKFLGTFLEAPLEAVSCYHEIGCSVEYFGEVNVILLTEDFQSYF